MSSITDSSYNNILPISKEKEEKRVKDKIPFWGEDPNILLQHVTELFPTNSMSYNQSLNAISRLLVVFGLVGYFTTGAIRIVFILAVTLAAIYCLWLFKTDKNKKKVRFAKTDQIETFENPALALLPKLPGPETFMKVTSGNPFGNPLMTDYVDNPDKKPAPPSFNENINEDILAKAKQTVTELNPGQPDMADKLFHDLGEQLVFEQSMRNFYSNASTTIPNDQTSFAEFCYGSMVSCKEGNKFACARNLSRHTL